MLCTFLVITFNEDIEHCKFGGGNQGLVVLVCVSCRIHITCLVNYSFVEHVVACHIGHSVYCVIYVHIVA